MQYIPRVTSLESPGFTPEHRDQVSINGWLMRFLANSYLSPDLSEQGDGDGIWVPELWQDGKVHAVYDGGVAEATAPNDEWTATGTITEATDETTFTNAGTQSRIEILPTIGGDVLFYARIKCTSIAASNDALLYLSDDEYHDVFARLDFGTSGAAGDMKVYGETSQTYSLGTTDLTSLLVLQQTTALTVLLYDTMEVITHALSENLSAPGSTRYRVTVDGAGAMVIGGSPAVVLMETR